MNMLERRDQLDVRSPGQLPVEYVVNARERALVNTETGEINPFVRLDRWGKQGLVAPRWLDAIATISAGEMGKDKTPIVATDKRIRLHDPDGRAPGLAAALKATDFKRLSICLPFDDIRDCLQQHYVRYTRTRQEMWGDLDQVTVSQVTKWGKDKRRDGQEYDVPLEVKRVTYDAGTQGYQNEITNPKTSLAWSLYFTLGEWRDRSEWPNGVPIGKPVVPDGLGFYRLRSGSPNGLDKILNRLELVYKLTHGHLTNIPLQLSLTLEERPDGMGMRRQVPLFDLIFLPPPGIALDKDSWLDMAIQARSATTWELPAPRPETFDMAEQDFQRGLMAPSGAELADLMGADMPAANNADHWRREFFGNVGRDSSLATKEERSTWLHQRTSRADWTGPRLTSLQAAIATLTNSQMQELVTSAAEYAAAERSERNRAGLPRIESRVSAPSEATAQLNQAVERIQEVELGEILEKARKYDAMAKALGWGQIEDQRAAGEPAATPQLATCPICRRPNQRCIPDPTRARRLPPILVCEDFRACAAYREMSDKADIPSQFSNQANDQVAQEQELTPQIEDQSLETDQPPVEATTSAAEGSVPPPASDAPASNSSVAVEGSPADLPPAGEPPAERRLDVTALLLQALRPTADGGQVFSCIQCGKQFESIGTPDHGDMPAADWLRLLAREGLTAPLCRDDARSELLRQQPRRKPRP